MIFEGDRVRLMRLRGVASPSMREYLGRVGLVIRRTNNATGWPVCVRFGEPDENDSFWVSEGEVEKEP